MKKTILIIMFSALAALTATGTATVATAATASGKLSTTEENEAVRQIEDYFRDLKTAQARFLQTAPDGTQLIGTFYLSRPGRLRFQYDDPVKDFIVADGTFIYFYDSQMGEQTNAPIGQTLADFLLRDNIRLNGDLRIIDVGMKAGLLTMTIVQRDDPNAGSITLGFARHENAPLELKKWRVRDATGAVTEVELFKMQRDVSFQKGLFSYVDPKQGKRTGYNQ